MCTCSMNRLLAHVERAERITISTCGAGLSIHGFSGWTVAMVDELTLGGLRLTSHSAGWTDEPLQSNKATRDAEQ